jgi:hypothetical protein
MKKLNQIKLFTFFEGETYSVLISKTEKVSSLKDHISLVLDGQLNPKSFDIVKLNLQQDCEHKKIDLCYNVELSHCFEDNDFFIIEKSLNEEMKIKDIVSVFSRLSISNTAKDEDSEPLLSKKKQ